jgi:hypothetical protein
MLDQLLRRARQRLEAARADHELAVGPGIAETHDADPHRPGTALGRDLRHHRNADAGGNHLPDRLEIIQPRTIAQSRAKPRRVSGDMGMQRARRGQSYEVAARYVAKVDLTPVRQFILPRHDKHQAIFAEGDSLDQVRQRVFGGKSQIRAAAGNRSGDFAALAVLRRRY